MKATPFMISIARQEYERMKNRNMSDREIARELGISQRTLTRYKIHFYTTLNSGS